MIFAIKALAGCALALVGLLVLWIAVAAGVQWVREIRLAWRHHRWMRALDKRLGI